MDNTGTALARAFRAIGDPQKRLQNLTGLIDSLSPWERRHARLQLGDSDGLAGFEDLPADIVCVLLRHLHIEDVLACAAVSRRCRATWTEPAVAAPVSVRFFPALRPPYTFSAFRRACRRYFRRRAGKFTSRTDMILPDPYVSSDPFYMQKWERCSALRPDPRLHPDGKYPRPWLDMFVALFACFGGGNIVWYALLDFFVVDNMYTLTRKVVRVPGGTTYPSPVEGKSAASKSLVALQPHSNDRLLVYNLETDTSSNYQFPSRLESMVIRERRIFAVLSGMQICVLDHDGSRLLTKLHFRADEGLEEKCAGFWTEFRPVFIYPHPHFEDRFFFAILGYMDEEPPPEGVASAADVEPEPQAPLKYLAVREFHGATPVALYHHDMYKLQAGKLVLPDPAPKSDSARRNAAALWQVFSHADGTEALDAQGTFGTGFSSVGERDDRVLDAAGLPPVPEGFKSYIYQWDFNVLTKDFCVQRHLEPKGMASRYGPPWDQQGLVTWVPRPGVMRVRRFDADEADFVPTRVSRPGATREREVPEGWTIELQGLQERVSHDCELYNDEDFTVLLLGDLRGLYVWSFVEDEEGEGEPGLCARDSRAMDVD